MADEQVTTDDVPAEEGEVKQESILTAEEGGEDKDAGEQKAGEDADHDKDGDTDDKSKDGKADKDKDGAPETYADFKLPEGAELDAELLGEFTPLLKEVGATQEQAQQLIDLQVKAIGKIAEAQQKVWTDTQDKWKTSAETDTEYGKGKYDESVTLARKAVREIGGPELSKALNDTGMGNHPEFIRFFYRVGKAIGEDSFTVGNATQAAPKSQAERIYPNQGS